MKRLMLAVGVGALTLSGFAQGTVWFNNVVNVVVRAPVYLGYPSLSGNGSEGYPPGTVNWAGFLLASGSEYSAALRAAPGANAPQSGLMQAQPVTTFRTGTAAGFVVGVEATLANVAADAPAATIQMVAWENKGGLFSNWASAQVAWMEGILRAGVSEPFNVYSIGGVLNPPAPLGGLRSFNILDMSLYPPPQVLAHPQNQLAVVGQTVTLHVAATTTIGVPLDYRWYHNRGQLAVPSSSSLVLTNVQAADAGDYVALVWSSAAGSIIYSTVSSNAVLKVISTPPRLLTGPGYGGPGPDGFRFTLLSDAGLTCDLQRSTNLLNWEGFMSVTNATGAIQLIDPGAGSQPYRFYRAAGRL